MTSARYSGASSRRPPQAIPSSSRETDSASSVTGAARPSVRQEPQATAVIEAFRTGRPMAAAIGDQDGALTVFVLNGNGLSGSAGEWSEVLGAAGFLVGSIEDAERSDYRETLVRVRSGQEADGESIVAALGFGRVEAGIVPADADVVVVLGADAAGTAG